jgi:hypothetical protein
MLIDQPLIPCEAFTKGMLDCPHTAQWILHGLPGEPACCQEHYDEAQHFDPSWVSGAERLVSSLDITLCLLYVHYHTKPIQLS